MMKEEGGKEKFRRLLDAAFNSVDYRFSETLAKYDISVDTEKIECLKKMAEIIAPLPSPAERDVYAAKIAEIMQVDKQAVVAEINQRRRRLQRYKEKEEQKKMCIRDRNKTRRLSAQNIIPYSFFSFQNRRTNLFSYSRDREC